MSLLDPVRELPLPIDGLLCEEIRLAPTFVRQYADLPLEVAQARFAEKWRSLSSPQFTQLRSKLSDFHLQSLVTTSQGWMLKLASNRLESVANEVDAIYWNQPDERVIAEIVHYSSVDSSLMRPFLEVVGGIKEWPTEVWGFPQRLEEVELFSDAYNACCGGRIMDFGYWRGALIFYRSRCNDCLLLNRRGELGWWYMPEARVQEVEVNFTGFLETYSERFLRDTGFDYYDWP